MVVAIALAVIALLIFGGWIWRDSKPPSSRSLDIKLKPDDPLESTAKLRLEQFQRGPEPGKKPDES